MRRPGRRATLVGLTAALLAVQGSILKAVWQGAPHPGGDNAAYVALGWSLLSGQGYAELWDPARAPHTKYPPVFPALLAARVATGGRTWGQLKSVPAALGLVSVVAAFLFAASRLGLPVGVGVALLTGLSTAVVDYSRWVLSDVPFLALTLLALGLAARAESASRESASGRTPAWSGALAFAALAALTRSAGLPLVAALLVALALRRHWRLLAVGGGAVLTVLGAWMLRTWLVAPTAGGYVNEFWMVDPYTPTLGFIGPVGLLARVAENAAMYSTVYLPAGVAGVSGGPASLVLVAVVLLGVVGWVRALRRRRGVAELFLPAYAALILAWPPVWSGDRFALPLIPLLLVFAAEALRDAARKVAPAATAGALAAVAVLVAALQVPSLLGMAQESAACRGAVRVGGPYACSTVGVAQFTDAARWAASHLPADAVALTRKPRIWYVLSGHPSRTYPFSNDGDVLLEAARAAGARYVLLDYVGTQGVRYLRPAVAERAGRFCAVVGFGGGAGQPRTALLGILPEAALGDAPVADAARTRIGPCPASFSISGPPTPYSASATIPILGSLSP